LNVADAADPVPVSLTAGTPGTRGSTVVAGTFATRYHD